MSAVTLVRVTEPATVAGTRALLVGGARILEQVGLCQGQGRSLDGRLCVLVAIHAAADGDWLHAEDAAQYLERFLRETDPLFETLERWNDEPTRTTQQVSSTLRAAAACARRAVRR